MEDKKTATEANAQPIAPAETTKVVDVEDLEAKNVALEAEKAKLIEEAANYKMAYLKAKQKAREEPTDEAEDEKMRQIAQETLANSRLAEIAREQDAIIKKALKENKEYRLAIANKTDVSATTGASTEGPVVKDTMVTPEQLAAFKKMGWTDKDIERYKKNMIRYSGR